MRQSLVRYLTEHAPDLMPYAQEAGLLVVDRQGMLRTHWNLCGALIFPTIAEGEITDLRARKLDVGAKARSLAGSPRERGAIYPFGWDDIAGADTVMLTESGEFKTLVPLAAYHAGDLSIPTIGCPGINGMPPTLGTALVAKGVRCVIIAYDSQPRPVTRWNHPARARGDLDAQARHAAGRRWIGGARAPAATQPRRSGQTTSQDRPGRRIVFDTARIASNSRSMMHRCSTTITRACRVRSCSMRTSHHRDLPHPARAPAPHSHPISSSRTHRTTDAGAGARRHPPTGCTACTAHDQGILVLAHPPGAGKGYQYDRRVEGLSAGRPRSGLHRLDIAAQGTDRRSGWAVVHSVTWSARRQLSEAA